MPLSVNFTPLFGSLHFLAIRRQSASFYTPGRHPDRPLSIHPLPLSIQPQNIAQKLRGRPLTLLHHRFSLPSPFFAPWTQNFAPCSRTMAPSSAPSFAHLSALNYPQWSGEMRAWLMKHGLWSIVSGETEPAPEEDIERREWRKRRDKAASELYLAVLPEQRSHFGGAQDDPVAMWSALEAAHVKRRPGARFNAYNSLFSLRKGDDETLSSLASRVEESMRTVQNLRPKTFTLSELDDELQSMALIRALPDVYNAFVDALLLMKKHKLRGLLEL